MYYPGSRCLLPIGGMSARPARSWLAVSLNLSDCASDLSHRANRVSAFAAPRKSQPRDDNSECQLGPWRRIPNPVAGYILTQSEYSLFGNIVILLTIIRNNEENTRSQKVVSNGATVDEPWLRMTIRRPPFHGCH